MTKDEALKKAFKQAFQLGQDYWYQADHEYESQNKKSDVTRAKFEQLMEDAIKEALAQPEQLRKENERLHVENRRLIDRIETIGVLVGVGGFATTPPQRTWVGLTDEDICEAAVKSQDGISPRDDTLRFAIAIEAKLKEKNT